MVQGKTLRWPLVLTQNKCRQVMKENVTWTTSLTAQQRDVGAADHIHTTCGAVVCGRMGTDYPGPKLKQTFKSLLKIIYRVGSLFMALNLAVVEM